MKSMKSCPTTTIFDHGRIKARKRCWANHECNADVFHWMRTQTPTLLCWARLQAAKNLVLAAVGVRQSLGSPSHWDCCLNETDSHVHNYVYVCV